MWTISRSSPEKRRLCGSPAVVTQRRGAGWRWGVCQGASSSERCKAIFIKIDFIIIRI
ncbi:unnamed protein product [Spirodela intermedia]|uniref:Uncharacterized protein n=1 Tax=Spirodela intermedia TaxID=51605 RepID=A0A7I8KUT7_SPIIN|nr:unnamed protein product [Spirodela intermedia]